MYALSFICSGKPSRQAINKTQVIVEPLWGDHLEVTLLCLKYVWKLDHHHILVDSGGVLMVGDRGQWTLTSPAPDTPARINHSSHCTLMMGRRRKRIFIRRIFRSYTSSIKNQSIPYWRQRKVFISKHWNLHCQSHHNVTYLNYSNHYPRRLYHHHHHHHHHHILNVNHHHHHHHHHHTEG